MHDIDDDERVQLMSSRIGNLGNSYQEYQLCLKDEIVHAQLFCPNGLTVRYDRLLNKNRV